MRLLLAFARGNEHDRLTHQNHRHLNIQGLLDVGLIRPGKYERSYYCDSCFEFGEVTWHERPDGSQRIVNRCDCSITPLKPEQLRSWRVVTPVLIQRLGETMGFKPPFMETLPRLIWSFGRKLRREFYFVGGLTHEDEAAVTGFFLPYPTAILLAAMHSTKQTLADLLPNHLCFSLEAVTTLDESCRLAVDMMGIDVAIVPPEVEPKRQRAKRGNRAANIEKLTAEMKEHCRTSKDHYYTHGRLLPRPTQEELAKRIGTRQDDVSRCLADPDATILQLLWKECENEKYILNT